MEDTDSGITERVLHGREESDAYWDKNHKDFLKLPGCDWLGCKSRNICP